MLTSLNVKFSSFLKVETISRQSQKGKAEPIKFHVIKMVKQNQQNKNMFRIIALFDCNRHLDNQYNAFKMNHKNISNGKTLINYIQGYDYYKQENKNHTYVYADYFIIRAQIIRFLINTFSSLDNAVSKNIKK